MTTYNTGNAVGSPAVKDLYDNAENFDEALNGSSSTWIDRRGNTRKAWASIENNIEAVEENANDQIAAVTQNANSQMSLVTQNANQSIDQTTNNANAIIAGLGYQVPVPYEAGIDLSLANQTVSYDGKVYAPISTELPFTTSGTFESEKFRLIQGVASVDLSAGSGAAMVGYLPPDAGAYPWDVSEKFNERVSLLNFVPKNKRDGIMNGVEDYDISSAVAAAFSEYEGAGSLELLLPRGTYHLDNRILTETSFDLSIQGAGANLTKIMVTSANGGIELDYSASSGRAHNVQLADLRLVAGVAGAGTAFKMLETPGGNRHERMFQARNVVLIGFDAQEHYFTKGIVLNGVWRPLFDNVIVSGPFAGAADPQAMSMGIDVTECYSPQFHSSRIWGADKGIVYENTSNPGPEGMWITDSKVVDCNVGVSVSSTGTEPSLQLANSHINSKDACLRVNKWKMLRIFGCLFYASDQATTNSAVLDLTDVQDTISVGNQYHVPSVDANTKSGIHLNGTCANFKSIGEMFRRFGSEAIRISAGSTNVRIIDPQFIDCAVDVNDLSNNAQVWKDGFMQSFGDGAVSGPKVGTMRQSDSPAAGDALGLFVSDGVNDAGERVTYAQMRSEISEPSGGEESGRIQIWTSVAGALARQATFGSGGMYVGNTAGDIPAGNSVNAESYYIKGVQVLSDQQSAISDATGGDEVVKINAILAALRSHGLIAS